MKPNISKILKELRALNNKTQSQIAEVLDISRQAYSRYESSMREPSLETLVKLAEYYDVSPQIFFIGNIDKPIDEEMDIVELSALYQAKKAKSNENETDEDLDNMKELLFNKLDYAVTVEDLSEEEKGKLADQEGVEYIPWSDEKKKRRRIGLYFFYVFILAAVINIGFMTIHRMDRNYEYPILSHSFINAIAPGQNVSQTMFTDIIKITPFDSSTIQVGDLVVIYEDFGVAEYWVEEVISIDMETQEVTVTYDSETAITVSFNDILGEYDSDANIFGTIYYTSKFNVGFMFLLTGHGLILAFIYYSFFDYKGKRW